ncbi:extracellular solute-binding protein [Halobacterium sp. CBA1126]|uniref:extracellular solute-binding protein n=1 Tax=Halobacterium TaxID=2239 RepID=UPI0012F9F518|nr:extracellular solute-binding protein [Halobacterium sp. CBA1126]MUV61291.1 extracellular solute-binding protein [Halobacterium sp. CBA1126]
MTEHTSQTRRRFLAAAGVASTTALAGCSGILGGGGDDGGDGGGDDRPGLTDFRGSGAYVSDRPAPGGTSIEELDDLEGELTVYLGGGEGGRYVNLMELFNEYYDDFEVTWDTQPSSQLANTIVEEHEAGTTQADVFWSVDIGSLAYVSENGAATTLSSDTVSPAFERYHPDDTWVGVAGRSRAIPYNTNEFSESEMPDSIDAFANDSRFAGNVGWAPTYGAFHGFITAMRHIRGEEATREWLNGMLEQNVNRYNNEYLVAQATANGELGTGFANHYYTMLVLSGRPDAPIDVTFTQNDAGSLVNAAGASVLEGTEQTDLAEGFIRHLLSAEAQEYLATRGFAYPMIPGVEPVGPLPTLDELEPPELDFQKLSDIQPTLELLRDVGILA